MLSSDWLAEDGRPDDIDPGKDIFALLFLAFFLINAVILFCISNQGVRMTRVNTAGDGPARQVEASSVATLTVEAGQVTIDQNGIRFVLPTDLSRLTRHGTFDRRTDEAGATHRTLIVKDPGTTLTAGQMLEAVALLNTADIGVDFHTPAVWNERAAL